MSSICQGAPKKSRASVVRLRTGCITCKIRRIKCDEQRPSCLRCTSTGRKCDGYDPKFTRPKDMSKSKTSPLAISTSVRYSIPFRIPGSQKDRQLFHYFCVRAATELSGFSTSEFWDRLVLQSGHNEATVRRALIALSSMHQDFVTNDAPDSRPVASPHTILEYNKGMRQLRRYMATSASPSRKVVLICCALYFCLEAARGEYGAAMGHLQSGLMILRDWVLQTGYVSSANPQADSPEAIGDFLQVFSRLDIQASAFDGTRTPTLSDVWRRGGSVIPPCLQLDFKEYSEARDVLDSLQNQIVSFLFMTALHLPAPQGVPEQIIQEKLELGRQLKAWDSAFKVLATQSRPGESDRNSWLIVIARGFKVLLEASFPPPDGVPLDFKSEFEDILTFAEKGLSSQSSGVPRIFSADINFIAPLYTVLIITRDFHLRARVLSLLKSCRRREGLMDSEMVVGVVETMIELQRREQAFIPDSPGEALRECESTADLIHTTTGGFNVFYDLLRARLEEPSVAEAT